MSTRGLEGIVAAMRDDERERMLELLLEAMSGEMPAGGAADPGRCPRYGCARVVRKGHDADGAQRWLCRGCGRTFRESTGKVLATTKLPASTWRRYAQMMVARATLRDCAAECGVSLRTSFSMRHRLLEAMGRSLPAFEAGPGCAVQADETLLPDSPSGNHRRAPGFRRPVPRAAAAATGCATA